MKYNKNEQAEKNIGTRKNIKIGLDSGKFFEKLIWNIGDASRYTGYAVGTLYNLVYQNLIPYRKKRGRLFFIPHEIQNWIEEGN